MLRFAVILLLLANAIFFAWSQGLLRGFGFGPASASEPQRVAQQIMPEALRIVSAEELRTQEAALAAAPRATECLLAGPFDEIGGQTLRQALQGWPAGTWSVEAVVEPARWTVYLGPYASAEEAARRRVELRQQGVAAEAVQDPALEPGLVVGGFATQAAANQRLERLGERGVGPARVVQTRAENRSQQLRLPAVDENLRERLDELRPVLAGNNLRPCRQP